MRSPSHRLPRSSPYRWAIGAQDVSPGQTVDNRYIVISPNIWRDTQLGRPTPEVFTADGDIANRAFAPLRQSLTPYHQLRQLRYAAVQAHLPVLDTVAMLNGRPIPLLRGALDLVGQPYPTLYDLWKQASGPQQLTWLWQLCPLWEALVTVGAAASLLQADNLRVDGDRLCLLSLVGDPPQEPSSSLLGRLWLPWLAYAGAIAPALQPIAQQLQTAPSPQGLFTAEYQLNCLLLQTAAQPFEVGVAQAVTAVEGASPVSYGATVGLPLAAVCARPASAPAQPSAPLASQIVQSLALQVEVMGGELARCGLLSPRWIVPQILAMVRVLNNILLAQELDEELSLAFAIAIPQPVPALDPQLENSPDSGRSSAPRPSAPRPSASGPRDASNDSAQEVYVFTTGGSFVYLMRDEVWQRVVPSTPLSTFLGERSDRLQGQLQRLVVEGDQLLLLSTYPLDDLLNQRQQPAVEALESETVDLEAIAQWVMSKTTSKGAVAIALLHHQSERSARPVDLTSAPVPSAPVPPAPVFPAPVSPAPVPPAPVPPIPVISGKTNRPAAPVSIASGNRPEVERPPANVNNPPPPASPPPRQVTAADFEEGSGIGDDFDSAAFGDLYSSVNLVRPREDDSINRYIDAEVRPPRPAANTILDQDIDRGLSTLVSKQTRPSDPARRDRATIDLPQTSQLRRKPVSTTPTRKLTSPEQNRGGKSRDRRPKTGRRKPSQRKRWARLMALLLLLTLAGAAGVTLAWRSDRFEPWLPSRQD